MTLHPGSNLLISIYVPGPTGASTWHPLALQTSYYATGDRASDAAGTAFATQYDHWYFLSGVDVARSDARGAVVTLGDSITDGAASLPNANGRWPDVMAGRLDALPKWRRLGVLNAGISGNRILLDGGMSGVDAIARFDRDVVAQSGVKDVIVLLGINDIQQTPHQNDPLQIEAGLRQLALQAHEHGLRVFGCTILPYGGFQTYQPAGEAARRAVNTFILTSGIFDGTCDFDRAIADPSDRTRMLPTYDSGDHLHPNTAGLKVMGSLIDINKL
jgi:lysophospholipase L1-like esterase